MFLMNIDFENSSNVNTRYLTLIAVYCWSDPYVSNIMNNKKKKKQLKNPFVPNITVGHICVKCSDSLKQTVMIGRKTKLKISDWLKHFARFNTNSCYMWLECLAFIKLKAILWFCFPNFWHEAENDFKYISVYLRSN